MEKLVMAELTKIANHLMTVKSWCEIPEETEAGINSCIDWIEDLEKKMNDYKTVNLNGMIEKAVNEREFDIDAETKTKLINALTMLACRFYVENSLDNSVFNELLYCEDANMKEYT